jgi:hypothetical protein
VPRAVSFRSYCGQSWVLIARSRGPRSRCKSCEECIRAKTKCDHREPCTKCLERGRECVYVNDPSLTSKKRQARRSSKSGPPFSFQPSRALFSQPAMNSPPPSVDSSTLCDDYSRSNITPGNIYSANNPSDTYDLSAWTMSGNTTPSSSPGGNLTGLPITSLTSPLPASPPDSSVTDFAAFIGSLPSYYNLSFPVDRIQAAVDYPVSATCCHTSGTCLCHTPMNPYGLDSSLSFALSNTGQCTLPENSTTEIGTISYPPALDNSFATNNTVAGHVVDSKYCIHSYSKSCYEVTYLLVSGISYGIPNTHQYHSTTQLSHPCDGMVAFGYPLVL